RPVLGTDLRARTGCRATADRESVRDQLLGRRTAVPIRLCKLTGCDRATCARSRRTVSGDEPSLGFSLALSSALRCPGALGQSGLLRPVRALVHGRAAMPWVWRATADASAPDRS